MWHRRVRGLAESAQDDPAVSRIRHREPAVLKARERVSAAVGPGLEKLAAIGRGKKYWLDYHPKEATISTGTSSTRMYTEPQLVDMMARFGFAKFEFIRRGPLRFMTSA